MTGAGGAEPGGGDGGAVGVTVVACAAEGGLGSVCARASVAAQTAARAYAHARLVGIMVLFCPPRGIDARVDAGRAADLRGSPEVSNPDCRKQAPAGAKVRGRVSAAWPVPGVVTMASIARGS